MKFDQMLSYFSGTFSCHSEKYDSTKLILAADVKHVTSPIRTAKKKTLP